MPEPPPTITPPRSAAEAAHVLPAVELEEARHRHSLFAGVGLLLLSLVAFVVFGVVAYWIRGLAPLSTDLYVTHVLQTASLAPVATAHPPVPIYDDMLEAVSIPGFWPYNLIMITIAVGVLLALKRVTEAGVAAVAFFGSQGLVEVVKFIVNRPRPTLANAQVEFFTNGSSFPSGHAAGYVCLFGFLFYLAWALMRHGWARRVVLVFTGAMVSLVGLSRIYLGQHWASDVLAGYALGFGWLCLCLWGYRRWEEWHLARLERLQQQARNAIITDKPGPAPAL